MVKFWCFGENWRMDTVLWWKVNYSIDFFLHFFNKKKLESIFLWNWIENVRCREKNSQSKKKTGLNKNKIFRKLNNISKIKTLKIWTKSIVYSFKSVDHGVKKKIYNIYKAALITFASIHTFVEIIMLTYCFNQLEIDELTVSVAYGIQHFLGIAKANIMWVHAKV